MESIPATTPVKAKIPKIIKYHTKTFQKLFFTISKDFLILLKIPFLFSIIK